MSKIYSNLPRAIPPKEIPFTVEITGSTTGFKYTGDFTVKVPTVKDMSRIGVLIARLNCGVQFNDLDTSTANLHNAIAYLQACLVDAPKWFINNENDDEPGIAYGLDTLDVNIPVLIFKKADALVSDWHAALKATQKPVDDHGKNP